MTLSKQQLGLFNYAARPEYQKEIFKLLADAFDALRNQNFELF